MAKLDPRSLIVVVGVAEERHRCVTIVLFVVIVVKVFVVVYVFDVVIDTVIVCVISLQCVVVNLL
jgi:hypothetical protein